MSTTTPTTIASLNDRLVRDRKVAATIFELTGKHLEDADVNLSFTMDAILKIKPMCIAEALIKVRVAGDRVCLEFGEKLVGEDPEVDAEILLDQETFFDAVKELAVLTGIHPSLLNT